MAKPRVFISSTFYDLRQVRSDLDLFLDQLGYESVRNEEGNIPYGNREELEEYCYKEIKTVDILISIIGGRFGTESKRSSGAESISQMELKTAIRENKQVYIFIDKNVLAEYETFLLNKDKKEMNFKYVDDRRIYEFIDGVKSLQINNNIKGFETSSDIARYLKEQFAGLFQRFLEEQGRIKEVNLINNLEKTAQTLNKLVNFLSEDNKEQTEEINRILTINHQLVDNLKSILDIPYNFYIEGVSDMTELLKARGFILYDNNPIEDTDSEDYFLFAKESKNKRILLRVSQKLFDKEGNLKFLKRTDWKEEYLESKEIDLPVSKVFDDDLPF